MPSAPQLAPRGFPPISAQSCVPVPVQGDPLQLALGEEGQLAPVGGEERLPGAFGARDRRRLEAVETSRRYRRDIPSCVASTARREPSGDTAKGAA